METKTVKSKMQSLLVLYDMQTTFFKNVIDWISDEDAHNRLNTKANHIAWLAGTLVEQRFNIARDFGKDVRQFGGELFNLPKVYHGVATMIKIMDSSDLIFHGCPPEVLVGRYHSWAVVKENLPSDLKITAVDEHGVIMALSHKTYDVKGVQFHPESIMTSYGKQMLQNFIVREVNSVKSNAIEYIY